MVKVRNHLKDAVRVVLERQPQRKQFFAHGLIHRREVAGLAAMRHGARGGQPHRSGFQPLAHQLLHGLQVLLGGLLAPYSALAHGINAQRAVGQQGCDVDVIAALG